MTSISMRRPKRPLLVVLMAALFSMMVGQASFAETAMQLVTDPAPLKIMTAAGERSFSIEVADTPDRQARGLMFRPSMGDEHGMLFVFSKPRPTSFWMKNTPMKLDLLFIEPDGRINAILPGEPFSEENISPGPVIIGYVLELKQGTSKREGIKVGDLVTHPRIHPSSE